MDRLQACGCTASECDGLTCGTIVSMTAQDLGVPDHYTVEQDPGGWTEVQSVPKGHLSNKSSRLEQGCMPRGQRPRKKKTVAQK